MRFFDSAILTTRFNFQNTKSWILEHAYFPPGQTKFELPLDFGFGQTFEGFYGLEYIPMKGSFKVDSAVAESDQRPEPTRVSHDIHVCPLWGSADIVQRHLFSWLEQTLVNGQDMYEWREACFQGSDVKWIRILLLTSWKYSMRNWEEAQQCEGNDAQLDGMLLESWMAALLIGMLSLPIKIPEERIESIRENLKHGTYDNKSRTSHALTRTVKTLFFELYQQLVQNFASALKNFAEVKADEVYGRRIGHLHCIGILIMVITCQLQTTLMNYGRLASLQPLNDLDIWETTFEQLRDLESAFKNSIQFAHRSNVRWLEKTSISDTKLSDFQLEVQEIGQTFYNGKSLIVSIILYP